MANEITLPVGATAEVATCGSCKFFQRATSAAPHEYETNRGLCLFRWPPFKQRFKELTYEETGENDRAPNWIVDTFGCDLYRHDGKFYIVQRRIPPMVGWPN